MPQTKPIVSIENVVASATVDQKMDLNAITKNFPDVEYHPDQFPGLVFRLKSPKTATLIFTSGKMVCTGAKSEQMSRNAVKTVVEKLRKGNVKVKKKCSIVFLSSIYGLVGQDISIYKNSKVQNFLIEENDKKYVSIKTEYEDIYNLEIDPDDFILKEQSKHKIIDIEKIIEFDLDELDDVININLTKDIYPEILLDIKERSKKEYVFTETDKKESLITELISSMDIYDNEMLIKKISIMANTIFDMLDTDVSINIYQQILNTNKFPDWLIPISNNLKRYYEHLLVRNN